MMAAVKNVYGEIMLSFVEVILAALLMAETALNSTQ